MNEETIRTSRNPDIKYINPALPPFEVSSPKGKNYIDTIPDTLDLAERAAHAVHMCTASTDPAANAEVYWRASFGWNPPQASVTRCFIGPGTGETTHAGAPCNASRPTDRWRGTDEGRRGPRKAPCAPAGLRLFPGVFLHLWQVYWMLIGTVKSWREIYSFPPTIWPKQITFAAWQYLWTKGGMGWSQRALNAYPIWLYFKNSLIIVGATMALQIPISAMVAYSLSKLHSPRWSRLLFLYFVGSILVPFEIALVPSFLMLRFFPFAIRRSITILGLTIPTLSFIDTFWAVILPSVANAWNILLFKGFFDTIPNEILWAARVDGASEVSILRRIVLPMSVPVFAVVAYGTFGGAWESFIWPLIVLQRTKLMPMSVYVYEASRTVFNPAIDTVSPGLEKVFETGSNTWSLMMVISFLQSLPAFIAFIIFREQLMKGIRLRGFK